MSRSRTPKIWQQSGIKPAVHAAFRSLAMLAITLPYARPVPCEASTHSHTGPVAHAEEATSARHASVLLPANGSEDGAPTSDGPDCHILTSCGVAPVAAVLAPAALEVGSSAELRPDLLPPLSHSCQPEDLNTPPPRA